MNAQKLTYAFSVSQISSTLGDGNGKKVRIHSISCWWRTAATATVMTNVKFTLKNVALTKTVFTHGASTINSAADIKYDGFHLDFPGGMVFGSNADASDGTKVDTNGQVVATIDGTVKDGGAATLEVDMAIAYSVE